MRDGKLGAGWVVKIQGRGIGGTGVVVAPDRVLTCAHVASTSGDDWEDEREPLEGASSLRVLIPDDSGVVPDDEAHSFRVVDVVFAEADRNRAGVRLDLALLYLADPVPTDLATPARFARGASAELLNPLVAGSRLALVAWGFDGKKRKLGEAHDLRGVLRPKFDPDGLDSFLTDLNLDRGKSGGPVCTRVADRDHCLGVVTMGGRLSPHASALGADAVLGFLTHETDSGLLCPELEVTDFEDLVQQLGDAPPAPEPATRSSQRTLLSVSVIVLLLLAGLLFQQLMEREPANASHSFGAPRSSSRDDSPPPISDMTLDLWRSMSPTARAARAEWLGEELPDFDFVGMERHRHASGDLEVAVYRHLALSAEFCLILGGLARLGSPDDEPGRREGESTIALPVKAFLVARTEVTNATWRRSGRDAPATELPFTGVSWTDAREFCESLDLALPTEVQWEYAARAGTLTPWSFGHDAEQTKRHAWSYENASTPQPVGRLSPNGFGLFDVHGNVAEWCVDAWSDVMQASTAAEANGAERRVVRGGSFGADPARLRSAYRTWEPETSRPAHIGLRPLKNLVP